MKKYVYISIVVLIAVVLFFVYSKKKEYDRQMADLHNKISQQQKTIDLKNGLYEKATATIDNLEYSLDAMTKNFNDANKTIEQLKKVIKQKDEEIVAANQLILKWKKAYEDEANAHQSEEGNRTRVDFEKDFGPIGVTGHTLTNPAYAYVKVEQLRPLVLGVVLTQGKDKSWHTYVTSSEENMNVDVAISAVNPYVFKQKWYEKISLDAGVNRMNDVTPYVSTSYRFDNGLYGSIGFWAGSEQTGLYTNIGYSFYPFK